MFEIKNLISSSLFEFDEQVTTNYLLQNGFNVIQTGIGDILLFLLLIEHRNINGPFYFNISIYIDNPYKLNNCLNSFSFKLKLLEKIYEKSNVIFFNDPHINYTPNWNNLQYINNFKLLHNKFKFYPPQYKDYIIFHTKCRFTSSFDYTHIKHELSKFCKTFKSNYQIIIMGEQTLPSNFETDRHKMTTIYYELLHLKTFNDDIIDLTLESIYDNLDIERYYNDISIIHHAKANILVGCGGQFVNSLLFGNKSLIYTIPELNPFIADNLKQDNIFIYTTLPNFFESLNLL